MSGTATAVFFLVLVLLLILLIITGVYATRAAVGTSSGGDSNIDQARTYLRWAAIVTWVSLGLLIIGIVIFILVVILGGVALFGTGVGEVAVVAEGGAAAGAAGEEALASQLLRQTAQQNAPSFLQSSLDWILAIGAIIIAILALTAGALSAGAAEEIASSPRFSQFTTAYYQAVTAAITGIGGVGLIVISFLVYYFARG